ncbi:chromosome partitioning protein [Mesorhizobium sp. Root157]|nr:chromosome partitioning protein [Mesorhizobium sp. Root157]
MAAPHVAPSVSPAPPLPVSSPASIWAALPAGRPDPWRVEQGRLVTVGRTDPAHVAFDILRTKVMHVMRENDWTSLMITSPTARCGKTVVGLNLAFSLANQKDCRTALVDLDLRRPQVAEVLGVKSPPSMEEFLKGNIGVENMFSRYGDNLAVASNNRPVRMAAELLQSPEAAHAVSAVRKKLAADIVIFDLPPMLANDDVMGFLPNVDCAILVVAAEESTVSEVDLCERELSEKTNLLGTVLNKCRYAPEKYGY